jgi:hypothetical protein
MANLKGSTFSKQIVNAKSRLNAIGQPRYGRESHLTHSVATAQKRDMYLRDFAKFLEKEGFSGKMNQAMTEKNIERFFSERLADLSPKSALDYVSGFHSMLQGLAETNVSIDDGALSYLRESVADFQAEWREAKDDFQTGRSVEDPERFLQNLGEIREESAIVAQLQLETGFRVSEALEVAKNPQEYLQENRISGVVGKGGQEYGEKHISDTLAQKLREVDISISYATYQRDVQELGHTSHDLRITYAKEEYERRIEQGYTHREALKAVSEEMNHHRESITAYYLARA